MWIIHQIKSSLALCGLIFHLKYFPDHRNMFILLCSSFVLTSSRTQQSLHLCPQVAILSGWHSLEWSRFAQHLVTARLENSFNVAYPPLVRWFQQKLKEWIWRLEWTIWGQEMHYHLERTYISKWGTTGDRNLGQTFPSSQFGTSGLPKWKMKSDSGFQHFGKRHKPGWDLRSPGALLGMTQMRKM